MILWLHGKGYTFFTIPKLTYPEINQLVSAFNRKMKKEERENKRASEKARRKR